MLVSSSFSGIAGPLQLQTRSARAVSVSLMRLLVLLLTLAQAIAALDLPFDADHNQVWLGGQVNGQGPVWLLFDSAAGGAGPATLQVPVLRGITLTYRGLEMNSPRVVSIPYDELSELFGRPIDGIIGKELLQRYVAEVDSLARKMVLFEPASFAYRGRGLVLPIRLLVDTAASHSLTFTSPFCRQHGLVDAVRSLSARLVTSVGGGVGGREIDLLGRIESIEIGPYSITRPVARFSSARAGSLRAHRFRCADRHGTAAPLPRDLRLFERSDDSRAERQPERTVRGGHERPESEVARPGTQTRVALDAAHTAQRSWTRCENRDRAGRRPAWKSRLSCAASRRQIDIPPLTA